MAANVSPLSVALRATARRDGLARRSGRCPEVGQSITSTRGPGVPCSITCSHEEGGLIHDQPHALCGPQEPEGYGNNLMVKH